MKTKQLLSSFFLPEMQRPEFIRRLWLVRDHGPVSDARIVNTL